METKTSFTIIRTRVGRPCNFSSAAHRAGRASRSIVRSFRAFAATKDPERESRQRDRSCRVDRSSVSNTIGRVPRGAERRHDHQVDRERGRAKKSPETTSTADISS